MKRNLLLFAVMLNALWASAQFSGSGTGTQNDPYLIFNENQLSQLNNFLNQSDVYFKLMKDIDLSAWINENNPSQGWVPVGISATPFKGKFEGNNHTISGLMIKRTSTDYVGFFGYLDGATISNLTLTGSAVEGNNYVGALCGRADNSTLNSNVTEVNTIAGGSYIGGLIGYTSLSTIASCQCSTSLKGAQSGGLVGYMSGSSLKACSSTGTVTGSTQLGGAVGTIDGTCSLTDVEFSGTLSGTSEVGGIVGQLKSGSSTTFTGCYSKSDIVNTGDYTGGIVGINNGPAIQNMTDCSHFGVINGKNYVGGLVGYSKGGVFENPPIYYGSSSNSTNRKNWQSTETTITESLSIHSISNCCAIGNITGLDYVGGLVGKDEIPGVTYTYFSSNPSNAIGIMGNIDNTWALWRGDKCIAAYSYYYSPEDKLNANLNHITNSYYSGKINGANYVGGIAGYKDGGEITKCYSYATMVQGESHVGGIAGHIQGQLPPTGFANTVQTDCKLYVKSNVAVNTSVNAAKSDLGRIYGSKSGSYVTIGALASAEGNRALTQTRVIMSGVVQNVEDNFQNGTSMGPSALKLKANYVALGWNFDNDWTMQETECYPYKRYQAAPPVIESDLVSQATAITGKSVNGGTVYLYYYGHDAVSTESVNQQWSFATEPLQSGAVVQLYSDVEGMTPSYFATTSVGYPGSGTKDDPYRVYTAEDLQGVSNYGYYKMMNDIDLTAWIAANSPTEGWIAIGRNSGEATYFDGDGHTVSGLWINTTDDYTGLFSNFSTGEICNLTVQIKEGLKVKGGDYTGGLIGRNANGKIENVTVKGDVEGTKHVGGVAGVITNNTLKNVNYEGTVRTSTAAAYIGGVIGQSTSSSDQLTQCEATATVSATSTGTGSFVGGIAGKTAGKMDKCHAQVAINNAGASAQTGGLVGQSGGAVTQCFSTGTVKATGNESNTGGLVGYATAAVTNCYSTVNTTGTQYTAGLVGYTKSRIDKCYAKGDVYGVNYGAGLVGELDGSNAKMTNSVAVNNIISLTAQSSWGSRVIGGYKNGASDPEETNYALNTMQVSLNNVPQTKTDDLVEGIAKTQTELQTATTYTARGWDFSNTWGIDEGCIYPFLLWEVTVSKVESITLNPTTLLIACGNTGTIAATVAPLSATNRSLEWSSSNEGVATVAGGVVTAKAIGTATITAAATDGSGVKATCQVTVCKNEGDAITVLRSLVENAQTLYDNSVEGTNVGEYASGARQQLLTVINAVKAQISDTMNAATITSCTATINAAVETFQSKKVTNSVDTDISSYDNILYAPTLEVTPGQQAMLSICLKNAIEFSSFEFSLILPEGVSIAWSEEDEDYAINLNPSRASLKRFTTTFAEQEDGSMHVICYSGQNYAFVGNDGEVLNILLDVDAEMPDGEYAICINNQEMATASMMKYNVTQCKSTMKVLAYVLGDVNGDHQVSVVDINGVVNLILGTNTDGLVAKAADTNCDGGISVVDINGVVNIILYGNPMGRVAAPALRGITLTPVDVRMSDVTLINGQTSQVSLTVDGAVGKYSSMQFDVTLPEGVTLDGESDKYHLVSTALQDDGSTRVVCTSLSNHPFSSSSPLTLVLTANEASEGDYSMTLKNIELASPDLTTAHSADFSTALRIQGITGIDMLNAADSQIIYNLQGIKMNDDIKLGEKELYIRNNKKVFNK